MNQSNTDNYPLLAYSPKTPQGAIHLIDYSLAATMYTANISDPNESRSNRFFEPDSRHSFFFRVQFESFNFQVIFPDIILKILILF